MDELHDLNIPRVHEITQKRGPNINMDAIYFITPTRGNIELIIADFTGTAKYHGLNSGI
jgi:hypothetical protein